MNLEHRVLEIKLNSKKKKKFQFEYEQQRGRRRGRQRILSRLHTVSTEPHVGLKLTNCEILT